MYGEARRASPSKREAIVTIAKELFLREGYAATSMAIIASKLGGSKTTLYNHFPSKEDLLNAVVAQMCANTATAFGTLDFEHHDIRKSLIDFGLSIVNFTMSDDTVAMHRLIAAEAERFPELGQTYYDAGVRVSAARLSYGFEKVMSAGRLRRRDPLIAAHHFIDMCLSDPHRRKLWNIGPRPTYAEIQVNVEAAVTDFLHGYGVTAEG